MAKQVYNYSELSSDLKAYLSSKGSLTIGSKIYLSFCEIYIDIL